MTTLANPNSGATPDSYDWRGMYLRPPAVDLVLPTGMICPLDDVVLQPLPPDGLWCPTCRGAWNAAGHDARWLPVPNAELSAFGGLTLPDMISIEDAAEDGGFLAREARVTCAGCRAWATPEHLDGERHLRTVRAVQADPTEGRGCDDPGCRAVCGNCGPGFVTGALVAVEPQLCIVPQSGGNAWDPVLCGRVLPCAVHGQVVDGRVLNHDDIDGSDTAAGARMQLRRVDRLLAGSIAAGAVVGLGYVAGQVIVPALPPSVVWVLIGAVVAAALIVAVVLLHRDGPHGSGVSDGR